VVQVQCDVTPHSKAGEIINDLQETLLPQLTATYPGLRYSFEERQADMKKNLSNLKVSFMLALLAIPFRSYIQPLIVRVAIPFGIIGSIFGHLLLGYSLSIMSLLGIVALSGVVVNDSLVLVTRANELRQEKDGTALQIIQVPQRVKIYQKATISMRFFLRVVKFSGKQKSNCSVSADEDQKKYDSRVLFRLPGFNKGKCVFDFLTL
jgi:Cu/Ag efflux pump CusA